MEPKPPEDLTKKTGYYPNPDGSRDFYRNGERTMRVLPDETKEYWRGEKMYDRRDRDGNKLPIEAAKAESAEPAPATELEKIGKLAEKAEKIAKLRETIANADKIIEENTGWQIKKDIIIRGKETKNQADLKRNERLKNMIKNDIEDDESKEDSWRDIAGFGVIGVLLERDKWGKN